MRRFSNYLCALAAVLASAAAQAHEFWMLPGRFDLEVGQAALLQLSVGQEFVGERVPFSPELVAGLWRFSAAGRVLDVQDCGMGQFHADPTIVANINRMAREGRAIKYVFDPRLG